MYYPVKKKKNLSAIINFPWNIPISCSVSGDICLAMREVLVLKCWTTLGAVLNETKYKLLSVYMVIAFLGNSVYINTVRKMFCILELSRVKFSTLIIRNSFSTYMDAWWDLWKPWRMQDSLVHCRYATSLPSPLNASRVPQSLWLPSPQCPKCPLGDSAIPFENHCSSCSLWKFLSSDICRAGSLLSPVRGLAWPPSLHSPHSLCHIAPFQFSVQHLSLSALFLFLVYCLFPATRT